MPRAIIIALSLFLLWSPANLFADDGLMPLEEIVAANQLVQPGLQNYIVTVETSRIEEMMQQLTSGMPSDVNPPPAPVIMKFWQRHGKGLVFAKGNPLNGYVEKMARRLSANLAIELNQMLLPQAQAEHRHSLAKAAKIKLSEVSLNDNLIQRLEIEFDKPTDLGEAFYVRGLRLPQKNIQKLSFDIDTTKKTVSEMSITTADELHLTVEIRYIDAVGGSIPERIQITSPDGRIDDRFEVKFTEIDGHLLPASMTRVIRRPDIEEDLDVFFKGYRINQPITRDILTRLETQGRE